jgi:lipopolysaccharide/colanic/teichoic acid biosynthesis glycosyltransferase
LLFSNVDVEGLRSLHSIPINVQHHFSDMNVEMTNSVLTSLPGDGRGFAEVHAGLTPSGRDEPIVWSSEGTPTCPCPSWKRAMDVTLASLALSLMLPLLVAVAVWIKVVSRGPVFFRQLRYGLAGRPFQIWKFRTIRTDDASHTHSAHVSNLMASDGRLTKLDNELAFIPGGTLLRKLGIDELPQLLNVLRGDMSLVGPRPDVLPLERYKTWQRHRFDVLPGITGLWQVSGKNQTTFSTMIWLDITYIRRRSVLFDLMILLRTVPTVLFD